MKAIIFLLAIFMTLNSEAQIAEKETYLADFKKELSKQWPDNRTLNIVFHGHSVPSGYFKTPAVNTL